MLKLSHKNFMSPAKPLIAAVLVVALVPLLGACTNNGGNANNLSSSSESSTTAEWRENSQARVEKLNKEVSATADRDKLPHNFYQVGPIVTEPPADPNTPEDVAFQLPAGPLQDIEMQARYTGEGAILLQVGDSPSVTSVEGKGDQETTLVKVPLQDDMADKLVKVQTKADSKGAWVVSLVCKKNTNPVCTEPAPTPSK